jgi:predicted DsbA family dithiol-disulfide isomerase
MNLPPPHPDRTAPIRVELVADLACPWCHLGLLRLLRAAGARPLALSWRAFFLNPGLPPEGVPRERYLVEKFGSLEAVAPMHARIAAGARALGVTLAFERIRTTPNTLDGQRLVLLAERHGLGVPMALALFQALFVDGLDIGEPATLVALAERVGLGAERAGSLLASEQDRDLARRRHPGSVPAGIAGVPVYVFAGRHVIAGAQPVEVLEGMIELATLAGG